MLGFGLFAVLGFWCLECLGFEVLRASFLNGILGFRVFRVGAL